MESGLLHSVAALLLISVVTGVTGIHVLTVTQNVG